MQKGTVMVKVPPLPQTWGTGHDEGLWGEEDRHGQKEGKKRGQTEGTVRGRAPGPSQWALGFASGKQPPPVPAACLPPPKYQLAEEERSQGQKAGDWQGEGAQRKGTLGGGGELCK
jgi:hypothetical protein